MLVREDREATEALVAEAKSRPEWQKFASYLELREKGRRAEALAFLDQFVCDAEQWPFADRKALLIWLGEKNAFGAFGTLIMPQPLCVRVAAPTASEWLEKEPDSALANYLYAVYAFPRDGAERPLDYLGRAVALDPADQIARRTFIRRVISRVQYTQHELPWHGYLGSASEDAQDLTAALGMAPGVDWAEESEVSAAELNERLDVARAWHDFEQASGPSDFELWCSENARPFRYERR